MTRPPRKTKSGRPTAKQVENALLAKSNPEKAAFFPRFFRTGPGEYGEGDKFIGVIVPNQRAIAKKFSDLPLNEIEKLLNNPFHECRLTGLFVLVSQFEKAKTDETRKEVYDFYVSHIDRVNNWDLVDSSCHKIMGPYLFERSRKPLFRFAKSKCLWKNRIAIVTTYYFIRRDDLETTIELAAILLDHKHDLIHKAVGWMLRELGKQNEQMLLLFLKQHSKDMPRTMLRYAIEKFPKAKRAKLLSGKF
jgi:3-methyladenine DNA glycosylase AlkD